MQGVAGDDERRMTIVQHLEELRRVLIWVLAAWIVGTAVAFIFNGFFLSLLLHPLHTVLHNSHSIIPGDQAIILNPTEGITVPLKISAVVGLILALPINSATTVSSFGSNAKYVGHTCGLNFATAAAFFSLSVSSATNNACLANGSSAGSVST